MDSNLQTFCGSWSPPDDLTRVAFLVFDLNRVTGRESRYAKTLESLGEDVTYVKDQVSNVVIPNVNLISSALRGQGGVVVWINPEWRASQARDWPVGYQAQVALIGLDTPSYAGCSNFELSEGLDVQPDDIHSTKFATSAFWGGNVLAILRGLDISHVLVAGAETRTAVVINALDSANNGFATTIVEDCCAGKTYSRHATSLRLRHEMYEITSTSEVMAILT